MRGAAVLSETFAANRAVGRINLLVGARDGITRRQRVYEDGPLRVRFPNTEDRALDGVIINTAGGVAGGDRHEIKIDVSEGARLTITSAASEKVYRSHGPAAEIDISLSIARGGTVTWLPQETILFDRSQLRRRIEVDLATDSTLVLAETVVFGRAAMGETVKNGLLFDRWRVRRDGKLLLAETVHLSGDIERKLTEQAIAGGGCALATMVVVPGDEALVERVRSVATFCGEAGISCWNGLAVARLCAKDAALLRHDLLSVLTALGTPLPRLCLQ